MDDVISDTAATPVQPIKLNANKWTKDEYAKVEKAYLDSGKDNSILEGLAKELKRTKRSLSGKLATEGLYVADVAAPKAKKDDGPTKGQIVDAIQATGEISVDGADGATKAFLKAVQALAERVGAQAS